MPNEVVAVVLLVLVAAAGAGTVELLVEGGGS